MAHVSGNGVDPCKNSVTDVFTLGSTH